MAINKKLIHFKNKTNFNNEVANNNILDTSIVFVQDSKEIHTHGTTYKSVNWSVLSNPTFFVRVTTVRPDGMHDVTGTFIMNPSMTWSEWVQSSYNNSGEVFGTNLIIGNDFGANVVQYGGHGPIRSSSKKVLGSDVIIEGNTYYIDLSAGGSN